MHLPIFILCLLAASPAFAESLVLDGETPSPAAHLYNPELKTSTQNTTAWQVNGRKTLRTAWKPGTSFTLEAYAKPASEPKQPMVAFAAGQHRAGCVFLKDWDQTYWGGFSDATKNASWQNGHYVTIARLTKKDLLWRHLALVYDAEKKTLTTWLDHWQQSEQRLEKELTWDGEVSIGGSDAATQWQGWLDDVRFTPRALAPEHFLRASAEELKDVSFEYSGGRFHPKSGVLDAKRHFGATGDGKHDDTAALQRALAAPGPDTTVFLPAGKYRVRDTLNFRQFLVMAGESQEKTVIQLDDACPGYTDRAKPKPVVRCLFNNNQSIANYVEHLTIDTGKGNPGAIALRYNAHNQGWAEALTLRSGDGSGVCGLDLSETEFGPALVKNVHIDGFAVGIDTPGSVSHATLEDIFLRGQSEVGIRNRMPMSLHRLRSTNTVPAVENLNWLAHLTFIDGKLDGGKAPQAVVNGKGGMYTLRNVTSSGYQALVAGETVVGAILGTGRKEHLGLPIADPAPAFTEPTEAWKIVDPTAEDDTAAVQAAMDSGAATVCFVFGRNYRISKTIEVGPKVRRIIGMRAYLGVKDAKKWPAEQPLMRLVGEAGPPLTVEQCYPNCDGQFYSWEIASGREVHLKASHGLVRNTAKAKGKLFITETLGYLRLDHPQSVWIRQFDTETHPDITADYKKDTHKVPTYLYNKGGNVWVLGQKTEHIAIHAHTLAGGKTEILGAFYRDHTGSKGVPYFLTEPGAQLSAAWLQFAHVPGATRSLQAVENGKEFVVKADNSATILYRAEP
jgi:hypothetical protein